MDCNASTVRHGRVRRLSFHARRKNVVIYRGIRIKYVPFKLTFLIRQYYYVTNSLFKVALFAIPIATIGNGFLVQWFKMHPNDPAMAYLDVDFESIVQRDDKEVRRLVLVLHLGLKSVLF